MRTITLHGLKRDAVQRLAEQTAGTPVSPQVLDAIATRSGGNPFFVEQIVGALAALDSPFDGDASELPIPLSVEAAVQSRLDHLPRAEKELCKLISVFDRAVEVDDVIAIGANEPRLSLRALRRRRLVTRRDERLFALKSPLLASVAYDLISSDVRRELHAKAALHLDQISPTSEELGRHLELSEQPAKAAEAYAAACHRAAKVGDGQTVLRTGARALELGMHGNRYALHMARVDAMRFSRRGGLSAELELAEAAASCPAEKSWAAGERSVLHRRRGELAAALEHGRRAVLSAEQDSDAEAMLQACCRYALALHATGDREAAVAQWERGEPLQESVSARLKLTFAAAQARLWADDFPIRRRATELQRALAHELGDARRIANVETNLADLYNRVGQFQLASEALSGAIEACAEVDHVTGEAYAKLNLSYALLGLKRPTEALKLLRDVSRTAERFDEVVLSSYAAVYRARAFLTLDELAKAEDEVGRAMQGAVDRPALLVPATSTAAEVALARGESARALDLARRARALMDQLGGIEEGELDVYAVHMRAAQSAGEINESERVRGEGQARLSERVDGITDAEFRKTFLNLPAARTLAAAKP